MSSEKTIDLHVSKPKKVETPTLVHSLVVLSGTEKGAVFPLTEGEVVIGRSDQRAQIVLTEPGISRAHAKFTVTSNKVTVEDLGSTNGVAVNGEMVEEPTTLKAGDTIALSGKTSLRFTLQDEQISELFMNLYKEAVLDTSGVLSRKSFFSRVKTGSECSLAVIELDGLESVLNRFGHSVETTLMSQVANVLKNGVAENGIVGRLSGEGFIVNLYRRALDADEVLEGVRKGIEFSNFRLETKSGLEFLRMTASIGIASVVSDDDLEDSVAAAEAALAMAKQMGRNRLHLSERKKFGRDDA